MKRSHRVIAVASVLALLAAGLAMNRITLASLDQMLPGFLIRPDKGVAQNPTPAVPGKSQPIDLGPISPAEIEGRGPLEFPNTRFALNGGSLRDAGKVVLNLVGPPPGSELEAAFLYWTWACLEEPIPRLHDGIKFKQVFPQKEQTAGVVQGELVATGDNPGWCDPSKKSWTYRLDVTEWMSPTGGGTYGVTLPRRAAGSERHSDPWVDSRCPEAEEPLAEGAVLIAVYRSSCEPNGTVIIYDQGLANATFAADPGVTYELLHGTSVSTGAETRIGFVGGDGQVGLGYTVLNGPGQIQSFVNDVLIAGPGSIYNDSDWNGSTNKPLPQLWDVSGHDITSLVPSGSTSTRVLFSGLGGTQNDLVLPIVNVLMIR